MININTEKDTGFLGGPEIWMTQNLLICPKLFYFYTKSQDSLNSHIAKLLDNHKYLRVQMLHECMKNEKNSKISPLERPLSIKIWYTAKNKRVHGSFAL